MKLGYKKWQMQYRIGSIPNGVLFVYFWFVFFGHKKMNNQKKSTFFKKKLKNIWILQKKVVTLQSFFEESQCRCSSVGQSS